MQSYEESVTVEQAGRNLQEECMAGFGFDIKFPPAGTNPPPSNNSMNMPRRYGITDRETAARYGYQLSESEEARPQGPQLSEAAVAVLTGRKGRGPNAELAPDTYKGKKIPKDGCAGSSFAKVGGRLDGSLPETLAYESQTKSQERPKVRSAIKDWSDCMKKSGYDVADPYDAVKLNPSSGNGQASQAEIATAIADIDCKKQTDLVKIWFEEETSIQHEQIAQNALALDELKKKNTAAVKAAERVLRG
ncbi:hypothetical protein [Streptomyces liangshanensis]|uniref:Uncharacterized protein n=1 Tax=Streptomyces liangshanensis TaxID=2717324 RepID=A0A6G9GWH6_9ACTN|nr:hypothetical protein [Streptomyces liangshanensis]QIQ02633.1 hypothetical protein HA039_10165 [Streptomyces liangshanensis]